MRLPNALLVFATAAAASFARAETDCAALPPCRGPYVPVCDSRDTTHLSECHFRAAQCQTPLLEIVAPGECCPVACPMVVDKVCGSDGKTYNSPCELLRARCDGAKSELRLVSRGLCGRTMDCSAINCGAAPYSPLCGSDYRTYDNDCELRRAQCLSGDPEEPSASYDGPCLGGPPGGASPLSAGDDMPLFMPQELDEDLEVGGSPDQTEPLEYVPESDDISECPGEGFTICATDGVTYGNVCAFAAARGADARVQFARLGRCEGAPEADAVETSETVDHCAFACPAPRVYEPVCTAAGAVFPNRCAFARALCRDLLLPPAHPDFCDPLVLPLR